MAEKIFLISWMEEPEGTPGMYEAENEKEAEEYIAGLVALDRIEIRLWKSYPFEVKIKIPAKL